MKTRIFNLIIIDESGSMQSIKKTWRDIHWEEDLQRTYDAGRKMAER